MEFIYALFSHYVKFNLERYRGNKLDKWDIWLHRLIRAGIGSGPVYRIDGPKYNNAKRGGSPFPSSFSNTPFGPALIRASLAEHGAPFSIHEYNEDGDYETVKWWKEMDISNDDKLNLVQMLNEYFNWFDSRDEYQYSPYDSNHLIDSLRYYEIGEFRVDSGI